MPASNVCQRRNAELSASGHNESAPASPFPSSSSATCSSYDSGAEGSYTYSHSDSGSDSNSSSDSASGVSGASSRDSKGNKKSRKKSVYQRFLPGFIYRHGRTVYGGNPIVQQTLPGVFSYVSPFIMIPIFYGFMVPFIVVGATVLTRSRTIYMVDVDYGSIHKYQYMPSDPAVNINQGIRSFEAEGVTHKQGTSTWMTFMVTKKMKAPVYMYYKIDNLYQNHRDFHDGRSTGQLRGIKKVGSTYLCDPYAKPGYIHDRGSNITISVNGRHLRAIDMLYNPCGLAAWSTFNDTLELYKVADTYSSSSTSGEEASTQDVMYGGEDGTLPLTLVCNGTDFDVRGEPLGQSGQPNRCAKKGISWRADADVRFKPLVLKDDWWSLHFQYPTNNEYLNNGWYLHEPGHSLQDPMDLDFQVWMKSAVLPSFRKLYRIIEVDLEPGTYVLHVDEFFDVVSFNGSKHMVLRTGNWIGDSNIALGVVFLVIGGLSFVMGVAFTVEMLLQRGGVMRTDRLEEPKRGWYVYDEQDPKFEKYYQLRTARHVPIAELVALRKLQDPHGTDSS